MFGIFNTTTIPALEQTLSFAQKRHELLAGNLAIHWQSKMGNGRATLLIQILI
jgi:hypothetical protein